MLEESYPRLMTCLYDNALKKLHYKAVHKIWILETGTQDIFTETENINMSRT